MVVNNIIKDSNFKAILGACWLVGTKDLVVIITKALKLFKSSGITVLYKTVASLYLLLLLFKQWLKMLFG